MSQKLLDLLDIVVETLTEANKIEEVEEVKFNKEGEPDGTKKVRKIPPPAYLGAAITLLKNNNITMPEGNKSRQQLEDTIRRRQAAARGNRSSIQAEALEDFERQGGNFQ